MRQGSIFESTLSVEDTLQETSLLYHLIVLRTQIPIPFPVLQTW